MFGCAMRDAILHAFNWRYSDIASRAPAIADAGYGAVLLAPPLYSDDKGSAWWQRYQPKDYRVLRSFLGRKRDLCGAIRALHDRGVRVYADLVFNHMANEKAFRPDEPYSFPGTAELFRYATERPNFERDRLYGNLDVGLFGPQDFHPQGDIVSWTSGTEVQSGWLGGLPDLSLNPWVVAQQRECLKALSALGLDGFRIDAMKHMPIEHLGQVFQIEELAGKYVFGETLTCSDPEEAAFLWPIIRDTAFPCYDFPLHETLRRVFAPSGTMRELVDPAARGQALPWSRAVTFTVTHDIPNNDGFRGLLLPPQDEYLANAYILGRDGGVPLVFTDDNESADRYPADRDRWRDAWARYDIVQMIHFHNAVHGTLQRSLFDHDGFIVFARGDRGIVAINKTNEWQSPTIWTWGLSQGRYRCQIHQHEMRIEGDTFSLDIPPRQAQMWLREDG
jgi:alpha-amylase